MEKIRHIERYTSGKFKSCELDITYPVAWGKDAVEARLASLAAQAEDAVRSGYSIIVISDRLLDRERVAIPALLALSAIHQHLVGKGLRTSSGLVVETGSVREKYFTGTASHVEAIDVFQVAEEAIRIHRAAFDERDPLLATMLDAGGEYAWRVRGEDHTWTPDAIAKLQHSARANSYGTYKEYAALVNDQSKRHHTFRGLFEFRFDQCKPLPIDEVEPAAEI